MACGVTCEMALLCGIDHFTVMCSVARPWSESEAGADQV